MWVCGIFRCRSANIFLAVFSQFYNLITYAEMVERSITVVLKTIDGNIRGFESLSLRHLKPWNLADSKAFSLFSSAEKIAYYLRTFELACVVDVAVNVRRRTHIRVSKPILNHLHRYFVGKE